MPRFLTVLLLSCGCVASSAAGWQATLVGVSDYRSKEIADLMYAESDVRLMRDAVARPGAASADVSVLVGEDAAKAGVRRGIAARIASAAAGDSLLFYFSGYGGTVVGADGVSRPVVWPWDGEPDDPSSAIPVADLLSWLADGPDALLILDCGFGSPSDASLYSPHRVKAIGDRAGSAFAGPPSANVTVLLAEAGSRPALESATLRRGVLTHHLVNGLTGAADADGDGWIRPGELVAHAATRMRESAYPQEASIVGASPESVAFQVVRPGARSAPRGADPVGGAPELILRVEQTSADPRVTRLVDALRAELGGESHVRLARAEQPPDGVLLVGATEETSDSIDFIARYVNPNAGADTIALRFSDATADTVAGAARAIASRLSAPIAEAAARKAIATLDNPHSSIRLRLDAPGRLAIGDTLSLTLTPSVDCYLILLNLSTDGSLNVLYPNGFVDGNKVAGGETITIPGADWQMRAYGPPGVEIVKAIATVAPVDLGDVDLKALMAKGVYSLAPDDSPDTLRRLAAALRSDMPTHEWAIDLATVVVGELPVGRKDPLELNALE